MTKFLVAFLANAVVCAVVAPFGGWMLMLAVGIAHHEWLPTVPTLGYWWAVVIVFLLKGVFSAPHITEE